MKKFSFILLSSLFIVGCSSTSSPLPKSCENYFNVSIEAAGDDKDVVNLVKTMREKMIEAWPKKTEEEKKLATTLCDTMSEAIKKKI